MSNEAKCPVMSGARKPTVAGATTNTDWWPSQMNLKILHQNSPLSDPMGKEFNYAERLRNNQIFLRRILKETAASKIAIRFKIPNFVQSMIVLR